MKPRFTGKTALVTGAGSGIGAATARLLAAEGARVAVNGRSADKCRAVVDEIVATGGEAIAVPADVTDADGVAAMVGTIADTYGPIDILVANAGISEVVTFADMTFEQWDRMVRNHLYGLYHCTKGVVPAMTTRGQGRIVVVSSLSARGGDAGLVHYGAAKAGQIGFAKALARELVDKGITVNVVAPGLTDTPILADVDDAIRAAYAPPVGWIGAAEDQAHAILYFASDAARYVTGEVLSPNGGRG